MRNFRFRLDPVIRLKEYHIGRVEETIARMEKEIQGYQREIDDGRIAIRERRRHLMEDIDDAHLLQAERQLDLFTVYTTEMERRLRVEIARLNHEKDRKQQELVKLYQERKALERLKERRKTEWETEMRKEESAMMDDIGMQNFVRRHREFGGVILYLLIPIALAAAVAAIGIATGVIDQKMLQKIPFLGGTTPRSATPTVESATQTITGQYLTLEQMIGDPDTPMPILLQNLSGKVDAIRKRELDLNERERLLDQKEKTISQMEQNIADITKQASDYLTTIQDLRRQLDEQKKSELSQYEETLAKTLSSAKGKDIAQIMVNLYNPSRPKADETRLLNEQKALQQEESALQDQLSQLMKDPKGADPVALQDIRAKIQTNQDKQRENQTNLAGTQKKIRDSQLLLLRILHRYQSRGFMDLITALQKSDPVTAASIISDFANTADMELYNIKPTPTPLAESASIPSSTSQTGAE